MLSVSIFRNLLQKLITMLHVSNVKDEQETEKFAFVSQQHSDKMSHEQTSPPQASLKQCSL